MRLPRFSLPFAILMLLGVMLGVYLVDALAGALELFSVYSCLWLSPAALGEGQVWRLLTYTLLPSGFLDLLMSGLMVVWLGSRVARVWPRMEFFLFCGICAAGAGVVWLLISPGPDEAVRGTQVLVLALLVAWARMFGHERVRLMASWEVRLLTLVLFFGAALILFSASMGGWRQGVLLFAAAGSGWLYLTLRWKANRAQPARAVDSSRFNRLEL